MSYSDLFPGSSREGYKPGKPAKPTLYDRYVVAVGQSMRERGEKLTAEEQLIELRAFNRIQQWESHTNEVF